LLLLLPLLIGYNFIAGSLNLAVQVACFGDSAHEAFRLALEATGFKLPSAQGSNVLVSIAKSDEDVTLDRRYEFRESMRTLSKLGFGLYGTPGTADYYQRLGIPVAAVAKPNGSSEELAKAGAAAASSSSSSSFCLGFGGGGGGGVGGRTLRPSTSMESIDSAAFRGVAIPPSNLTAAAAAAASAAALVGVTAESSSSAGQGLGSSTSVAEAAMKDATGQDGKPVEEEEEEEEEEEGVEAPVEMGINTTTTPSALELIKSGKIALVINVPEGSRKDAASTSSGYLIRRTTVDFGVSLITNVKVARMFVESEERHRATAHLPQPPPKTIQEFYRTGVHVPAGDLA
jgi:hypothetical protein